MTNKVLALVFAASLISSFAAANEEAKCVCMKDGKVVEAADKAACEAAGGACEAAK